MSSGTLCGLQISVATHVASKASVASVSATRSATAGMRPGALHVERYNTQGSPPPLSSS